MSSRRTFLKRSVAAVSSATALSSATISTVSALSSVAFVRYPADAAEFNYKFATEQPDDHHMTLRLVEAAAAIKRESNGQLDIRVFSNSSLGNQTQMVAMVRSGAVEFISSADFILASVAPIAGITAVPFAFNDHTEALAAMRGPLGAYRRAAVSKVGVYPFEQVWDEGFRQIINNVRPVATPGDLHGIKLRIPPSPIVTALFQALGASPTSLSMNETYLALKTNLVDGLELPVAAVEAYKIYEVQKYVSYTNHMWTAFTMLANADAWQRLPKSLQDIVERNVDKAGQSDNADDAKVEATTEATLKGQGMQFNRADVASFRTVVRNAHLYSQWRDLYGPEAWALLEGAVGTLT